MAAQVVLEGIRGNSRGERFVFSGKTREVVGRASGCSLRVPGDDPTVSRYHCLLEIDAPLMWVEDLDSLNGTFVNDESIGRRDWGRTTETVCQAKAPPRLLVDGDELRIGDNVFEVVIDEMYGEEEDGESVGELYMMVA